MTSTYGIAVVAVVVGATAVANAQRAEVSLSEKPNHVTEASVVVNATPAEVYAVATDYARWPQNLHDIPWAKVEAGGARDARVRFRSNAFGNEITLQFDNIPDRAIRFRAVEAPPGTRASGTYLLEPIDGGKRTRVVATLYADVRGLPGVFVGEGKVRGMRQAKLRSDLGDVARLFATRATARR